MWSFFVYDVLYFRSYFDICYPLTERLSFLLTKLPSPALGFMETRLKSVSKPVSRWKTAVLKIKRDKDKEVVSSNAGDNGEELKKFKKVRLATLLMYFSKNTFLLSE